MDTAAPVQAGLGLVEGERTRWVTAALQEDESEAAGNPPVSGLPALFFHRPDGPLQGNALREKGVGVQKEEERRPAGSDPGAQLACAPLWSGKDGDPERQCANESVCHMLGSVVRAAVAEDYLKAHSS